MDKYRVYAIMDEKEYGLCHVSYDDDRLDRFELILNEDKSTIYLSEEIANEAIDTHRRSRPDQKVDEYKTVTVLN